MNTRTFQHWRFTIDSDAIAHIIIDRQDASTNSLNREVLTELSICLDELDEKNIKGLIISSAKANGFIAGADINQFKQLETEQQAIEVLQAGQAIFKKLEQLTIPTLAKIHGACLGGGFELALACRYRIALDETKTKIGLPEVMLGIHPGWGGCVRLPRLIGPIKAMQLILSGRALNAKQAAKIGMIDAAVPQRHFDSAARQIILTQPAVKSAGRVAKFINMTYVRPLVAKIMRRQVGKKAKLAHYPAPYAAIDNWVKHGVSDAAYAAEAGSDAKLILTDTAKNLVRVFFLQERLKNFAKQSDFPVEHVHVIGAGTMGGDIAAWCALRGFKVTLQDRAAEYIAPAMQRATQLMQKKLKQKHLIQAAIDRLIPDVEGDGVAQADVIIEAIFENLAAKQALFKDLEQRSSKDCILATNTSSIPLDDINTVLQKPERLIGLHFFNPVAQMPLVEVVKGEQTNAKLLENALAFVGKIGRLPLPVKSKPGFLVNRILMPYLLEAMLLLNEGVDKIVIDKAAVDFGMPMGPVELADTVGLDVCLSVAKNLTQHYGGNIPEQLINSVEQGNLGKKSGKGFYTYKNGKKQTSSNDKKTTKINDAAQRLVLRLINEAFACLRENIVTDADLLDVGMIFGAGFAPFRGGPIHYARAMGIDKLTAQFQQYAHDYGERFKPDEGWRKVDESAA